jgi:hypothetical protein
VERQQRPRRAAAQAHRRWPPTGAGRGAAARLPRLGAAAAAARRAAGRQLGRPTDVAWTRQGNIFVADGYTNSRVAKFDKDGAFVKCIGASGRGSAGRGEGQFSTPHTMAADAKGNIYIGDRGNARIQVLDSDLNVKKVFTNVRSPWGHVHHATQRQRPAIHLQRRRGRQDLQARLDGNLLGWFGSNGKKVGQFTWVHSMHCASENEILHR